MDAVARQEYKRSRVLVRVAAHFTEANSPFTSPNATKTRAFSSAGHPENHSCDMKFLLFFTAICTPTNEMPSLRFPRVILTFGRLDLGNAFSQTFATGYLYGKLFGRSTMPIVQAPIAPNDCCISEALHTCRQSQYRGNCQ